MSQTPSVVQWIHALPRRDGQAAASLWRRYYRRLVYLARRQTGTRLGWVDEEDVAAMALQSFLRRAERGQFDRLTGRREVWRLLAKITVRKVANARRHGRRLKRCAGRSSPPGAASVSPWEGPLCRHPTPEGMARVRELYARVLHRLDPELRQIVDDRLAGYTIVEIAARLGRSVPTIERRLRLLRHKCHEEGLPCLIE